MQSKCNDLERFKALRMQATTPESAEAVRTQYHEHIKSTDHDRAVDERIQQAALEGHHNTWWYDSGALNPEHGHGWHGGYEIQVPSQSAGREVDVNLVAATATHGRQHR